MKFANSVPGRRRIGWLVAALLAVGVGTTIGLGAWLSAKGESLVLARLADRGIHLSYGSRAWLPWRGLTFRDVVLHDDAARTAPLATVSNLSVELSAPAIWQSRAFLTRWTTDRADLSISHAAGPVTLPKVSSDLHVAPGSITINKLTMRRGNVSASLTGEIRFQRAREGADRTAGPRPTERLRQTDLSGLRRTIEELDLASQSKDLRIEGTASFDLTEKPARWSLSLTGEGRGVEWRGLPLDHYSGEIKVTEQGLNGSSQLALPHGRIDISAAQASGKNLEFSGSAVDSNGKTSQFKGQWVASAHALRLSRVSGQTDWLSLARDIPTVQRALPRSVTAVHFPALTAEKLEWLPAEAASTWRIGSLRLTSPGAFTLALAGRPLELTEITGTAAFDGRAWRLSKARVRVLGGTVEGSGMWADGVFANSSIRGQGVQMQQLTKWLERPNRRLGSGQISFTYEGQVGMKSSQATGRGQVRMSEAPLVDVPLLEQTWQFFSQLVPGSLGKGAGEMTSTFAVNRGRVRIDDFKAQSQAITVTAQGTIDLPAQTIEARARGELRGVAGLATMPLSRAMGMKISGPLKEPHVTVQDPLTATAGLVQGAGEAALKATGLPAKALKQGASLPLRLWRSFSGTESTQ